MENKKQGLINKINSTYIIQNIFNYIKNRNLKMKLFFYSKSFQKKLGIKLFDYKEKYFEKIGFDISKYLYVEELKYEKDYLIKKYGKF